LLSKVPVTKIYTYKDSTKPTLVQSLHVSTCIDSHCIQIAELCVNGEAVVMPIVHLTSDRSTNPEKKRATQLENLFVYSKQFPHTVLVGDFNFGDGPEQDAVNWGQYKDVWLELHPTDVGFTFDPCKNALADITSQSKKQRRLDRIIVRSDKLKGTRIEIIGNKGTAIKLTEAEKEQCKSESDEWVLYPSDHFGLYCELSSNK
jgi:endonuclease/exonuclease/phosphatase family metal-dependent hydrolase